MTTHYNLYKVGGILIRDRKLLVCRSRGKQSFIAPGGKLKASERATETLARELKEELDISVREPEMEMFGTFYAPAAEDEKNMLRMDAFLVKQWGNEIHPCNEVEEISWINSKETGRMKVGSIFKHQVIPKLKELNLID